MLNNYARAADVVMVTLGALAAHALRHGPALHLSDTDKLLLVLNGVLVLLLFPMLGVYQAWRGKPRFMLMSRIALSWFAVSIVSLLIVFTLHRSDAVSRLWIGYSTLISCALLMFEKIVAYAVLGRIRGLGLNQKTVAIVGSEGYTRAILQQIRRTPRAGFRPACAFDPSSSCTTNSILNVPVIGEFRAFAQWVRAQRIDEIWLALPLSQERELIRFNHEFRHDFINLRFLPDVRALSLLSHSMVDVLGMPAINLAAAPVSRPEMWPKLVFDRLFAGFALLVLSPLLAVLAVSIKCSSPGPALFKQQRKGIDGRPFSIYKFRTMRLHTESGGAVLQARRGDPRITRLGAFLRRTSLDELPQFFNVLLGQMSVVGPRPHALAHDDLYKDQVDGYMFRYRILPGITGWAQINGYRGETSRIENMEARVKFDLFYIENWSFWFDIKIVLLTFYKGFSGRNAY